MSTIEFPPGEPSSAQLRSVWNRHLLRDFDMRVIIQISGCERSAAQLLRGEPLSGVDVGSLALANHAARHMGYLPLFDLSGKVPVITEGGEAVLREVLPKRTVPVERPR
ncbi:hypothetical protein [Paenarthrobacter nitroguajacolicus]|uniref:hypothetical protein n=1 Tax=Paenarthrobacter nitroguajacolicus TaxID=211146 RepID=UPI004053F565